MCGNRASERILQVGVDVHLDDTVAHGLCDFFGGRTRAAVKDEVERLVFAILRADSCLNFAEQFWAQLHVARLVYAVHVSES